MSGANRGRRAWPAARFPAAIRLARDRGSIAPLVPIVMFALLLLGGLVVDGSRELNARGNAQAYAEEAARAGATAVDLTSSTLALQTSEAETRVVNYCNAILGAHANVTITSCGLATPAFTDATTCDGKQAQIVVNTEVKMQVNTTLLGLIGVSDMTASGYAKARPFEGTNAANAC